MITIDGMVELSRRTLFGFYLGCLGAALVGSTWLFYKFDFSASAAGITALWVFATGLVLLCVQKRLWAAVILIACSLRFLMLVITEGAISQTPDPYYYATLARHISVGSDYVDVDAAQGLEFRAHAPRLYSLLLGGTYFVLAGSKLAPALLNAFIDAATGALIFKTARSLGARHRQAVGMGVLYFVWPHIVVSSVFAQKEGLGSLLVLACAWTLLCSWNDGKNRAIQYGLILGLLGLSQPAFFLMAASFPVALVLRHPASFVAKFLSIAAVATVLVLTPWILRNFAVTGGFVPLTTGMGMNLYANATHTLVYPPHLHNLPEAEWYRGAVQSAFAVIGADPWSYARHEAAMMFRAFALEHGLYLTLQGVKPAPRVAPEDFLIAMQLPLLALWASAAACLRYRRDQVMIVLFTIILVHMLTVSIWFEFGARHRAFLLPLILAWAATLSVSTIRRDKGKIALD